MANLQKWLPAAVAVALFVSACSGPVGGPQIHTISVTGTGSTRLAPDLALVTLGVQTRGPDVREAVEENNRRAAEVMAALREMGLADRDIATASFNVSTQQIYDERGRPTGEVQYWVDNVINLRVRQLDRLGEILQVALRRGANTVQSVTFTVENPEEALDAARLLAMQDAVNQAQALAQAAGVELGEVLSVNEPVYAPLYMEAAQSVFGKGGGGDYVPTAPGVLEYQVQISVTYVIR